MNGWDELQTYRKDGRYTIDNLPAERAIRPFTVSRKNSLHYNSEEGVEMEWLLGFTACSEGLKNTDYESMTPEVVIAKRNS